MDSELKDSGISQDKPKRRTLRIVLVFIVSTCWILNGPLPLLPIGALLCIAISRPKKVRTYILILIAAMIGFVGTGLHITIAKNKQINTDTGKETYPRTISAGARFGTESINYFQNRGKMVIFSDASYLTEVEQANTYVREFIEQYNANDPSFILNTFIYQQGITQKQVLDLFNTVRESAGDIISSEYIGYLSWVYPNQKKADITVVHNVTFENDCGLGSIHFRLIFFPDGLKLTKIDFVNKDIEYKIVKGMQARNPFNPELD